MRIEKVLHGEGKEMTAVWLILRDTLTVGLRWAYEERRKVVGALEVHSC